MSRKPQTAEDWLEFLQAFNRDLLERIDSAYIGRLRESGQTFEAALARYGVTDQVLQSGWLGYAPATDDQLARLESRLGKPLPPSYRALLRASNGFRMPQMNIPRLRPADEVQWLRAENQPLIDLFKPAEDMSNMIQISDQELSGSAINLLNPSIVSADGEWEAVRFAHWIPGCTKYASLWELMRFDYTFSVVWCDRGDGALGRSERIDALSTKLPMLLAQFDRLMRVVREDPWFEGPPWRDTFLGILQIARARVVAIINEGYSAPVAFDHLRTLFDDFRANAFERQRGAPDPARQHGWSRAMGLLAWFLNGRQAL